jgi:hypothetical protein
MSIKKHCNDTQKYEAIECETENNLSDLEPDHKEEAQVRQERHQQYQEYDAQLRLLPVAGSAASDLERTTSPPLL